MPSLQMPSVDAQSSVFGSPKKLTGRSEGVGGLVKEIGGSESNPQYSVYNIQPYFRPPTGKFGYSKPSLLTQNTLSSAWIRARKTYSQARK